jgi:transcriptional regulator with XRE-family HTH domain
MATPSKQPAGQALRKALERASQQSSEQVAERLIELRTSRGLSQARLAELADVDRKTINRIENGHFSPSLDTLTRLSVVLKCRLADFLKSTTSSRR